MSEGYPDDWNRRRLKVYRRDGWKCQACGQGTGSGRAQELHAHHIVPKSKGGAHNLNNLVTVCDYCHAEIHDDPRLRAENTTSSSTWKGHLGVGLATGWWSFGLGNLWYESRRREKANQEQELTDSEREELENLKRAAKNGDASIYRDNREVSVDHTLIAILTGWWSFGLGNLVYEYFREPGSPMVGEDGLERLGKREDSDWYWQNRVDQARNDAYGGCPNCRKNSLTVSWLKLDDGTKTKVVECEACTTKFNETADGLDRVQDVSELDSGKSAVIQELFG